jgi:hypothetical protein
MPFVSRSIQRQVRVVLRQILAIQKPSRNGVCKTCVWVICLAVPGFMLPMFLKVDPEFAKKSSKQPQLPRKGKAHLFLNEQCQRSSVAVQEVLFTYRTNFAVTEKSC